MQRLKNRAQFQAVLAGLTIARSGHFAMHRLQLSATQFETAPALPPALQPDPSVRQPLFEETGVWIGAMVPKRWAKRAVTRNMIKRKIYSLAASAQLQTTEALATTAFVIRLRSAFDVRVYKSATSTQLKSAVDQELLELITKGFQHA